MRVCGVPSRIRTIWRRFRARAARRRTWRRARRLLREFLAGSIADPARLAGTSLSPRHSTRADLAEVEVEGDELTGIHFTIVRHPRPFPFSRQFHEVAQLYRLDLATRTVRHVRSLNLSRLRGHDSGEPSG